MLRIRTSVLLFVLCSAASAFATTPLWITPAQPTTATPVTLWTMGDAVTIDSIQHFVIHARLLTTPVDPPTSEPTAVQIGLLPAGEYRVELRPSPNDSVIATTTFVVREAALPFSITPSAVPIAGGTRVRLSSTSNQPLCSPSCSVAIGGVQVDKVVDEQGNVWFTAPAHAAGRVEVTVTRGDTLRASIHYFDPNGKPDLGVFERILFPLLFDAPGANGSHWVTEATISNPMRAVVETFAERFAPGALVHRVGGDAPRGFTMLVPRDEAPSMSFELRARDTAREAESYGVEIPVVRESDLIVGDPAAVVATARQAREITLLDVPLERGYRTKLRIYSFDPAMDAFTAEMGVRVRINRVAGGISELRAPLKRDCEPRLCEVTPWYAEVDLPQGTATGNGARADVFVEVRGGAMSWAFITVTNNTTQQVTVVTPSRKGGPTFATNAFEVHPSGIPSSEFERPHVYVPFDREAADVHALCASGCTVRVGGVAATDVAHTLDALTFLPPVLPAGTYDVTIFSSSTAASSTATKALTYFNRNDPVALERVLFPVLFNTRGANGSEWRTEAVILNPNHWTIDTANYIDPIICVTYPCAERLAAHSRRTTLDGASPHGIALLVPRGEADNLAFSLRVRDVSRAAENLGTAIPVVHERDMYTTGTIPLLDVPLDPRYRVNVRVYAFTDAAEARMVVGTKRIIPFTLENGCTDCLETPAYAEIRMTTGAPGERANLYIQTPPSVLAWAFATITNNATQEVTVVTPDGTGGEPCTVCSIP
ncbi:MAG: hypothetical protein M3Q69_10465 [Acidobacteriota bacterium]|nr:hypothetical protein [Acidobacteriota bacterium]